MLVSIAFGGRQQQIVQVKPDGDWKGTLDAAGTKLDLVLHISSKEAALGATLDSPDQGATGLPIDSIGVTGKSLRFEMKSLGANYEVYLAQMAHKSKVNSHSIAGSLVGFVMT